MPSSNATKVYAPFFQSIEGHLHPKLEVPRLTCLGRESKADLCGGSQDNSYSDSLYCKLFGTSIYEPATKENARNMAPPGACVTLTYMNTYELH